MPKIVVYVPARLWRQIETLGLADPKVEARQVMVGALEAMLAEGPMGARTDAATSPSAPARPSVSTDPHFKPDFK